MTSCSCRQLPLVVQSSIINHDYYSMFFLQALVFFLEDDQASLHHPLVFGISFLFQIAFKIPFGFSIRHSAAAP
jgi:hypothetical protein